MFLKTEKKFNKAIAKPAVARNVDGTAKHEARRSSILGVSSQSKAKELTLTPKVLHAAFAKENQVIFD